MTIIRLLEGEIKTADEYREYVCPCCQIQFKIRPVNMLIDGWAGVRYCYCPRCHHKVDYSDEKKVEE